jgi:hypothetical protein
MTGCHWHNALRSFDGCQRYSHQQQLSSQHSPLPLQPAANLSSGFSLAVISTPGRYQDLESCSNNPSKNHVYFHFQQQVHELYISKGLIHILPKVLSRLFL